MSADLRPVPDITPARAARIAGLSYVALFVLAVFANFFVRVRLVEPDDAAATFANFAEHDGLVRLGVVAFVVIFLLDVVVAWALHQVLRPAGAAASLLAAWFRVVYTVFLGVAVVFLFAVLQLTSGDAALTTFDQGQLDAQVVLALDAFNATWLVGLVAFGIHLVLVGGLMLRSRVAPPLLGAVLVVAGAAYAFDTAMYALLPTYADHEELFTSIVAVPSVVAELGFLLWLLARSRRRDEAVPGTPAPDQPLAAIA